jgi:hypothetical protein
MNDIRRTDGDLVQYPIHLLLCFNSFAGGGGGGGLRVACVGAKGV